MLLKMAKFHSPFMAEQYSIWCLDFKHTPQKKMPLSSNDHFSLGGHVLSSNPFPMNTLCVLISHVKPDYIGQGRSAPSAIKGLGGRPRLKRRTESLENAQTPGSSSNFSAQAKVLQVWSQNLASLGNLLQMYILSPWPRPTRSKHLNV